MLRQFVSVVESRAGGRGRVRAVLTDIWYLRVEQNETESITNLLASERHAFSEKLAREYNDDANLDRLLASDSGRQKVVEAFAALTAEGMNKDLTTDAVTKLSEDIIANYSHASFVADRKRHGAELLVDYLSAVMRDLSTRRRRPQPRRPSRPPSRSASSAARRRPSPPYTPR